MPHFIWPVCDFRVFDGSRTTVRNHIYTEVPSVERQVEEVPQKVSGPQEKFLWWKRA